jgi:hypothetical protein
MKSASPIDTLVHTFLSDDQLIEYIARDVKRYLKENRCQNQLNRSKIVSQTIDRTFEELHLSELVTAFLERTTPKISLTSPEYSETEPTKFLKSKRKGKKRDEVFYEEHPTVELDFNQTQYINPENISIQFDQPTNLRQKSKGTDDVTGQIQIELPDEANSPDEVPISCLSPPQVSSPARNISQDEYSVHEFEVMTPEPEIPTLSPETKPNPDPENPQSRRVNFLDGLISDTFVPREKHSPEEVPDLFYTHEESIKFQYDYDREAQRADTEGITWLDWMMKRTEDDRKKHEEEDDLLQHEYQDYWEGNDQYEDEESQSGDEMWEF